MSTTLYRKYRPATFSEIIGQRHVVKTLKNAVKSERIGQAYLFAGPRGTGKTSLARIFAKTINCGHLKNGDPCLKCASCKLIAENRALDIIEIDAASNTGVDNIRELRETVKLPPSSLKYKVYIIDEVHMLSGGAFNALLKTLEEPPAHVVFILATTEVHKIPETILSRVQRFDFTRLTLEEIITRLGEIAKLEKVKIDREALEIIASSSEGGMRNAESLLGQVIALEDKKITAKEVEFLLGTVSEKFTADFAGLVIEQKLSELFAKIGELREIGVDFKSFGKSLLNYFRQMLILKINPDLGKKLSYEITKERLEQIQKQIGQIEVEGILGFIENLQESSEKFKSSPIPQLFLEIAIAKLAAENDPARLSPFPKGRVGEEFKNNFKPKNPPLAPPLSKEDQLGEKKTEEETPGNQTAEQPKKVENKPSTKINIDDILLNWPQIIESLKDYNHSLSSVLKLCQPALVDEEYLVLKTKYSFYCEKIVDAQNRLTIEDAIAKITDAQLKIKALTETEFLENYPDHKNEKSLLQEAVDIFGGKIVSD
ncbi:MAG: DNA polymerase III subunit gamma/tau [Candidatus Moranbacteria bacterium]|nr:DNA polymerase III subunit gamma/tau [Candidatus Moranbacteria bacterium]